MLAKAKRAYTGTSLRLKWEYKCNDCQEFFPMKNIQVNHLEPGGDLTNSEDLTEYINRLFCEERKAAGAMYRLS